MNDLQRRALMGDRQAQAECSAKGILLPCPYCGCRMELKESSGILYYFAECVWCGSKAVGSSNKTLAIACANTRPAPPVGRCKDCRYFGGVSDGQGSCSCDKIEVQDGAGVYPFENDYCSYFEPKEEKANGLG